MTKYQLEHYRIEQVVKVIVFSLGLTVAFILALVDSQYTTIAFTFIGGLLGGSALEKKG